MTLRWIVATAISSALSLQACDGRATGSNVNVVDNHAPATPLASARTAKAKVTVGSKTYVLANGGCGAPNNLFSLTFEPNLSDKLDGRPSDHLVLYAPVGAGRFTNGHLDATLGGMTYSTKTAAGDLDGTFKGITKDGVRLAGSFSC
jgi:hypothetical protein